MAKHRDNNRNAKRGRKPDPTKKPAGGARLNAIPAEGIRLNRYIAQSGLCSRRKADDLIRQGRVKVNGTVVADFGTRVMKGDTVDTGGRLLTPRPFAYYLLNKPKDTITTTSDERGRKTILDLFDIPEEEREGLFPVGRLDRHTTGVLLVTNDGDLAHRLMHPRYEITKLYRVRTQNPVQSHELGRLRDGIELEDGIAKADQISYIDARTPNELGIQIHEGRNRQIRRMLGKIGHEVVALERTHYAGMTTAGLRAGRWRRLASHEVKRLRQKVKLH